MRFLVVLFFVFIFSFVVLAPAGVFAFSGSGSGTSGSPYLVTSCSQLEEVANNLTAYYQQTADIDCTGTTYIPIGSSGSQFTGTYDGNGFKIEHVTIDSILGYVGLFGVVGNGGVVTKVGLVSGSVTVNDDDQEPETGGIVGENHGTISKSYSLVDITNAPRRSYVGGIVGLNYGTVSDAYATGDVTETGIESEVGGVVGDSTSGQVMRVYSTGSVTGGDENGGLVGEGVTLSDSFSTAIV
ncbi:MAG TPA: GLUG motif-containing protein, partial [Patescibacteria group bacterium]|nr:GLUG motif-containing protein [Patescibacteria group bacterium]